MTAQDLPGSHPVQLTLVAMVKRPLGGPREKAAVVPAFSGLKLHPRYRENKSRLINRETLKLKLKVSVQKTKGWKPAFKEAVELVVLVEELAATGLNTSLEERKIIRWQVSRGSRCS